MRIISWNTNGLRATIKQGYFWPLFKKHKPDILCFQETKAELEQIPETERNIPGYYSYFSHSKTRKGYSGVAIYTKEKPLEVFEGMGKKKLDQEGRLLGVKFKNFTLITVYFPNGGSGDDRLKYKLEFYDAFLNFILNLRKKGEKIIFCGDINTAHNEIDLTHPKANQDSTGFLPIERAWITKVINNNFIDIFRLFFPNKKETYTYWDIKSRARERNVGWRLDYFFVDAKLIPKIKETGMLINHQGSDHCPIFLYLDI
jgi:exodeoxyribonuclease-3